MGNNTGDQLPIWAVKIKARRLFLEETQTTFGARFGVGKMAVSKWETGKTEPPADVLVFIFYGGVHVGK